MKISKLFLIINTMYKIIIIIITIFKIIKRRLSWLLASEDDALKIIFTVDCKFKGVSQMY